MSVTSGSIEQDIIDLKKQKNVEILAHFYEDGEIQDLADHIGDSLFLAQQGVRSKSPNILLAGVVFMGESVKLLSPEKTVLVPDMKAGCSLVTSSPVDRFVQWRQQNPDAICVTYVNSSAAVKANSDVICTSSNAEKIVRAIPADRKVLFAPDKNLGRWLSHRIGREMLLWEGSCEVHILFSAKQLSLLKGQHPDAVVLAHPECDDGILGLSDVVGSTSHLLNEVVKNPAKKFIVATEDGIFHQMKKSRPGVELIQAPTAEGCGCNQCPYMKLNTLEKIRNSLLTFRPQISVDPQIATQARVSLQRMMDITDGKSVLWPSRFSPTLGAETKELR
jgi:quinolinate synthase